VVAAALEAVEAARGQAEEEEQAEAGPGAEERAQAEPEQEAAEPVQGAAEPERDLEAAAEAFIIPTSRDTEPTRRTTSQRALLARPGTASIIAAFSGAAASSRIRSSRNTPMR
jgi:hypothetical protein